MYIPSARCRWASGSRGWWVNGGCSMFLLHMFLTSSAVLETNISEGVIHLQYLHSHAIIPPISIIACSCKCSYLTLDSRKCEGMSHRHLIDLTGENEVQWIIAVLVHMTSLNIHQLCLIQCFTCRRGISVWWWGVLPWWELRCYVILPSCSFT